MAGPDNRASDAEREVALARLRDAFADGRLSHETFSHRVEDVLRARANRDLLSLVADLPSPHRLRMAVLAACRRTMRAGDRWLRKPAASLTLPAGSQSRFTIGREPACDMTLLDRTVSRWHACLNREEDGWLLTDLGSTNGTRLNGWRVNAPIAVSPGDLVSFGAATFVLTERPGMVR